MQELPLGPGAASPKAPALIQHCLERYKELKAKVVEQLAKIRQEKVEIEMAKLEIKA